VRQGSVFQDDAGHWIVASATTPDKRYSVNGLCSCDDAFYRAPQGRCKHKLAQLLARKVQALMQVSDDVGTQAAQAPQEPTSAPQTTMETSSTLDAPHGLPEAPASVNCHITVAGRQVQLTLRDSDEARLLQRLQTVLERFPVAQASSSSQGTGEGWCTLHGVAMKWNAGKEGRKGWWSHRTQEGPWCQGRRRP
jgi:hypothetical protein